MAPKSPDAYTYMGVIDDNVARFPWKFRIDQQALDYLLAVELINGKPILLNDGYLVLNPFARSALLKGDGLLWELIRAGFVRVLARGGSAYGLHEMPIRMAATIPTFADLVYNRVPGVRWKDLQAKLAQLDAILRAENHLVSWPGYDTGSGFLALSQNLRDRDASAHDLGIGRYVAKNTMKSFIGEVTDRLTADPRAARTTWETVARTYADNPDHSNAPDRFMLALMNLGNEMYHYNMGILLAAEHGASVSVQTQTSPAFDDLLVPPSLQFLASEVSNLPKLNVPLVVASADPIRLARILMPGTKVFDTRATWLALRHQWDNSPPEKRAAIDKPLRAAGQEYSTRLSEHVGSYIKFKETEELIEFAVGDYVKGVATGAVLATLVGAGVSPLAAAGGALAVGYAITRGRKKMLGNVFKKFRVVVLDKIFTLPPTLAESSARAMRIIKRRQVPSTVEITPSVAAVIRPRLKRFDG